MRGSDEDRGRFAFLYQSEAGVIDAPTWRRAAGAIAAIFLVLTLVYILVRPIAARGLADRAGLFDAAALAANVAVLLYAVAAMLLGISWVNLSAKRFRDLGRRPPLGLAGLLPLVILADGTLRWLQPQIADVLPHALVYLGDIAVLAALAWTVAVCAGLVPRRG